MTDPRLSEAYQALHTEAETLAGGLTDLSQRATVYHHLYRASGGSHIFPLIAAHGALWAGGYFRLGMELGRWLSWQYVSDPHLRREKLRSLAKFADAFRDINRRVCVDTYTNLHFTARFGQHPDAAAFVPADLLEALNRLHAATQCGRCLTDAEKYQVFESHFLNEQESVVGPAISAAVEAFSWPLVKALALRPVIRFAYFRRYEWFSFGNFSVQDERIEKGMQAFHMGEREGWDRVERSLAEYRVLPAAFFEDAVTYFAALRESALRHA